VATTLTSLSQGRGAARAAAAMARGRGTATAATGAQGGGNSTAAVTLVCGTEAATAAAMATQGGGIATAAAMAACGRGTGTAAVAVSGGAGIVNDGGMRNYTDTKVSLMLQCICRVLPIGNDQRELVAELHGNQFSYCSRTAESICQKFSSLANQQPSTGDPSLPHLVAKAKEIREIINVKAGVSDADVSEFFVDEDFGDPVECTAEEQQLEEEQPVEQPSPPHSSSNSSKLPPISSYNHSTIYKFWSWYWFNCHISGNQ
jgi:hypothetical protein